MGASKHKTFMKVLLPAALPSIITGHILAVSNGWRALVGAEMLAGSGYGLGYMIFDARTFMDTETVYGGIIMIALLGLLIEKACSSRCDASRLSVGARLERHKGIYYEHTVQPSGAPTQSGSTLCFKTFTTDSGRVVKAIGDANISIAEGSSRHSSVRPAAENRHFSTWWPDSSNHRLERCR